MGIPAIFLAIVVLASIDPANETQSKVPLSVVIDQTKELEKKQAKSKAKEVAVKAKKYDPQSASEATGYTIRKLDEQQLVVVGIGPNKFY